MFQYSNKMIIKEYIFPTFLYIFDPVCIIYQHFRTWKWGLDTHFANCLKSGTMILLNSAGSITSRISSSSFRNITCNTHLSKYNLKLLTELPKISGFPLISTFDSIYCKTCVKQTKTCNSICAHSIHTNFFLFLTKTFNHTLHKQEKKEQNIKTYLLRTMDFWPKL